MRTARGEPAASVRRVPWASRAHARPIAEPEHDLLTTLDYNGLRWINIERPTDQTVAYLQANFPFHDPDLEDVLDKLQQPKLDEYDDYLFLVVQFPVHRKATRTTTASEVDIFVGRDYVITIHDATLRPLGRLFDEAERDPAALAELLGRGADRLLHRILDRLLDYCFPIVRRIDQHIEQIDEIIFEPNTLRAVQEIALVRRDVIITRRIIKLQVGVITALESRVPAFFHRDDEELEAYYGDLVDHVAKLSDLLDNAKEVVEALAATADSVATHRLNEIIKVLTIFSVIMLPLTLLSSIYGMNVPLPLQEHPLSFILLLVAMAGLAGAMVAFFRWRRWL